jgi:predicted AlkP superfamily pyrophosphatase or phosphodiesterase
MINATSREAVAAARWGERWVRPLYDTYGFAHLPRVIQSVLTDDHTVPLPFGDDLRQPYDAVVLLFVDAFGWRFFERHADHPFLARIVRDGVVSQLTSQFPSTTTAHVTTIHTGMPVGEHGAYEWFFYEPQVDAVIAPLLFSYAGEKGRDGLLARGVDPATIFPRSNIYQHLAAHDVRSWVFLDESYAHSPFSLTVAQGATTVPYRTLPDALAMLAQQIQHQRGRSYYMLYYDRIDLAGHAYGADGPEIEAEIALFLDHLERSLHDALDQSGKRCLFLMTADHGQTTVDPSETIYLNRTLPQITPWIRTNQQGQPIVPAGWMRDFFLHIRDEHLHEAHHALTQHLEGRADVFLVEDLIRQGFFGTTTPSVTFRGRVGNLVILPYQNESVWWHHQGASGMRLRGLHGGLSADEMETILYAQAYG